MKTSVEIKPLRTIVGAKPHYINKDVWALSLVRGRGKHHAYLILEGMDEEGERVMEAAHFRIKEGTDDKKGEVTFGDMAIEKLKKVGENCHSYTWDIIKEQVEKFHSIVNDELERDIDYVHFGKSKTNGLLGESLDHSGSTRSKQSLHDNSGQYSCMDALLRKGHNCLSWAKAVVKALELGTPTSWVSFVATDPERELQGNHDGKELKRCILS
jgi:hypothetical protein